jgi:hypothetical protein
MSNPQTPVSDAPTPVSSKEGSSRYVQEKVMAALGLVFFGGVLAMTVVPAPFSGVAMGIILFLTLVAMFRFN